MRSGSCGSISRWALGCLLAWAGCSSTGPKAAPPADTWEDVCVDADGDGRGFQCEAGEDCDESDPNVFEGCKACSKPSEGCECEDGAAPVDCDLPKELTASGGLLCRTGTRYCRDSVWSECEGIKSFEAPPPSRHLTNAVIDQDAAPVICDPCHPDCYRLEDPIAPIGDGGPPGSTIEYQSGGGITLTSYVNDAALPNASDELDIIPPCDPSAGPAGDTDCDGVPNGLDPYPDEKPFATDHTTIFMDLPPGASGSTTRLLEFSINTADIYFLIDMTGSMNEEKTALFNSLSSGNYLDNPATTGVDESAGIDCSDGPDADELPDNSLKTGGITGNIACLIKNSGFGLGWFREIPFSASDDYAIRYAYPDFEAYEHRQDISTNVSLTSNALDLLYTRGNRNWAESATVALSAVATGGPIYMGWDRPGIPPKVCPAGTFGYPCFRNEAIPMVVLITDAPMMNGPVPSQGHLGNENSNYPTNGADKQPVNYQPNGLRYTSLSSDSMYHPVSGNEAYATAYDVGVIDDSFKTYTGDTRGMSADVHAGNLGILCSSGWPSNADSASSPGYPDAVFKFTVQNSKTLTVSTRGTRHAPTLAIVPASAATTAPTAVTASTSNHNVANAQNLGTLGANINLNISGSTASSTFNTGDFPTYAMRDCFRGTGGSPLAPDAVFRFQVSQSGPVTFAADGSGFEAVLALYQTLPTSMSDHAIVNSPTGGSANDRFWEAGAVVPTGTTSAPGAVNGRAIWMRGGDTSVAVVNNYATSFFTDVPGDSSCNNVTGTARDAVFDFRVTGTSSKTVSFEVTGSADSTASAAFDHVIALNSRPSTSGGSFPAAASACDKNGAGTRRSSLTRTLAPGTYSLVLRGERRTSGWWSEDDKGQYGLIISDDSVQPLGCHNESVSNSFTANLTAGVQYYLVMRGRNTSSGSGRGAYSIRMSNASGGACAFDNTTYAGGSGDSSYNPHVAEVTQLFAPGDYYAVVKGNANNANWSPMPPSSDTARGWYQLTLGDPTLATDNQVATMPQWGDASSGVLQQLNAHSIHVVNVTSTIAVSGYSGGATNQNQALQAQADAISNATGAVSTAGTALRFDIRNDGQGMGFAVVDAIAKLTNNLKMDVSVRFVPLPDAPAAPTAFVFVGRAIDNGAADGCDGVADLDSDGVLDTHLGCLPGAEPRFELTFTNPPATSPLSESKHVRLNGTKGGYDMRVEVIGRELTGSDNNWKWIDSVPVYIVPEDVVEDPPPFLYNATGFYYQDVTAAGCMGTERPDWRSLYWTGTHPAGTSTSWSMCAGQTADELQACISANGWQLIADVRPGGSCAGPADCPNGYCTETFVCEYPERPGCSNDVDCGSSGKCVSNTCVWTANPIDLKPAVASGFNGLKYVRLKVQLNASASRVYAPSITSLGLNYLCAPGE